MKNKKVIVYINWVVVVLAALAIFFNFSQCQYFEQIVFLLAVLSIVLLLLNIFLLRSFKQIEVEKTLKQIVEDEQVSSEGNHKMIDNYYLELVSKIKNEGAIEKIIDLKIKEIADEIQLTAALIYVIEEDVLKLKSTYALSIKDQLSEIKIGEGLTGQVAKDGLPIEIDIPEQIDIEIISGLGKSKPNFLYLLPVFDKTKIVGVLELATFIKLESEKIEFLIEAFRK